MPSLRPRRSAVWSIVWPVLYRLIRILDPVIRSWSVSELPGFDGVVELRVPGRRSGRIRGTLVTLLLHDGQWYVGHPNGVTNWQRNAEAAGWVDMEPAGALGPRFTVQRLPPGAERDSVIRATARQQFFPANVVYRAAQRHIAAVGVYHRLEPLTVDRSRSASAARGPDPADPLNEGAR